MTIKIMRHREWAFPPAPVRREVLIATPAEGSDAPPVLFVPGFNHGAWAFAEHWLEHAAERGFPAYAMSLRGHGESGSTPKATLRAYAHDVTQVAASLPRQAVLVGHGASALVVAMALARYPARAAVLVSPVFGGVRAAFSALVRAPVVAAPAIVGRPLRPRRGHLFSRELPIADGTRYAARLGRASARAQWQLVAHSGPENPVGDPPVLVVGSPDDRIVGRAALTAVARRYAGAPLLFPGMGHDLMLDVSWKEPIDAILDWLDKPDR
ncbi:MAG TPA: alpha/beta fold hydrolase [Planosporangium sp.]|jgi:pimeloyl-ACP methyl ester carboxylesterase|nr:alpha/beta fold hydrolase [Planosporangium sp.]